MPKYRVTLSDGRKVTVEADAPPSEEDVLGALGGDTTADTPTPPKTTFANEPTTYGAGFKKSVKESLSPAGLTKTLGGFASGAVSGAARMLDPRTYLSSDGVEHERMRAEATGGRAPSTDYGMSDVQALGDSLSTPEGIGELTGATMMGMAGPRLVTKIPAARRAVGGAIERVGAAMDAGGPMAGITRNAIGSTAGAVVGGPVGAAIGGAAGVAAPAMVRGTGRLIRGRVPPPAAAAEAAAPLAAEAAAPLAAEGPMLGPSPKPKLSAKETVAMLRDLHGSEQAGRMLWGKVQKTSGPGSSVRSAAERQAAIKRLTPEGVTKLPSAPTRDIAARLATSSPADAVTYANKAPNAIARDYFGEQLTAAAGDLAPGTPSNAMAIERAMAEAQLRDALLARLKAK